MASPSHPPGAALAADAALAASIFHYKEIDIIDLKHYLHNEGIAVRL
jgi:cyclase